MPLPQPTPLSSPLIRLPSSPLAGLRSTQAALTTSSPLHAVSYCPWSLSPSLLPPFSDGTRSSFLWGTPLLTPGVILTLEPPPSSPPPSPPSPPPPQSSSQPLPPPPQPVAVEGQGTRPGVNLKTAGVAVTAGIPNVERQRETDQPDCGEFIDVLTDPQIRRRGCAYCRVGGSGPTAKFQASVG